MTKKEQKRFENAKKNAEKTKEFYQQFAKQNGSELTYFKQIEEDIFEDGVPRCITVFTKNAV